MTDLKGRCKVSCNLRLLQRGSVNRRTVDEPRSGGLQVGEERASGAARSAHRRNRVPCSQAVLTAEELLVEEKRAAIEMRGSGGCPRRRNKAGLSEEVAPTRTRAVAEALRLDG